MQRQVKGCEFTFFFHVNITMSMYGQKLHNYLILASSRDVIDHVTIRFPIWGFLLVLHWNQAPISKRFRDIRLQTYLGHDIDLLGSRDVIGHVTI